MAKGKTESPLPYSERKEIAFELFWKRWRNVDIAARIGVTPETVSNYRREWEKEKENAAWDDPNYLNKIIQHTLEGVQSLERVIEQAWVITESSENDNARVSALRIVKDSQMDIAKLQRLLDTRIEIIDQAEKATQVQTIILEMINVIVEEFPEAKQRLAERLNQVTELREGNEVKALEGKTIDADFKEIEG